MKNFLQSFINILYPPLCVGCRKILPRTEDIRYLCEYCFNSIKRHQPPFCQRCGRGLPEKSMVKGICPHCLERHYAFDEAWIACRYEGIMKDMILRFKYSGKHYYQKIFYSFIQEFFSTYSVLRSVDMIVPIALHPARLREREYNQALIISTIIGEILQKPVVEKLKRIRNTPSQAALPEHQRLKNVTNCFAISDGSDIIGTTILLVDDVLTTGATLSEAARLIKEYKPQKVTVFTLAG